MVSGVCFRGWYVLYLLLLGWEGMAHKHNSGDTLSGCVTQDPRVGPMGACAIHPTHFFLHGSHISRLVYGLNGIWCSFQGGWYVCVNSESAGVGLGRGGT